MNRNTPTNSADGDRFSNYRELPECPHWPQISAYGSGDTAWQKMCSAVAETFASEEGGTATHIHFYATRKEAQELNVEIPETILTVSFRPEKVEEHFEYFATRGGKYTIDNKPMFAYGPVEALRSAYNLEKHNIQVGDIITVCMNSEPKGRWSYRVDEGVFTLVGER